jgi:hypothetical protein
VPRAFDPKTLWSREDIERATAWIQGHTHFDLRLFPEYWGSVHLIAPNPIFRQVHGRMECTNEITELVLGIDLRRGKSVDGLVFELEEHRPTGVGWVIRERVTAPIQRIRLPGYPESASERVYDDRRGLLYELDSFVFGVTFAGEIDLVTETRRVSVSDRAGGVEQYEVSLKGIRTSKFEVGTPRTGREGAARLWAAAADRERRNGGEGAQRWFRAQAVDATIELRKLVGVARRRVFVVDPYFEGDDLHRVLLAVHDPSVPIMVLAGSGHLKSRREDTGIEHGDFLAQRIAEALASGRMSPLEVRTMAGEPPVIHDRLLLVDDDMWMLGSSLNGYGQRGTLRVKVPYPEPVLTDVMIVWNEAKPFDTWLEERRQARST